MCCLLYVCVMMTCSYRHTCFRNMFRYVFWQISEQYVNVWVSLACVCRVCFLHYSSWCLESEFPAHGLCLRWARACNTAAAIQEIFFVAPFWLIFFLTLQLHYCIMMWNNCSVGTLAEKKHLLWRCPSLNVDLLYKFDVLLKVYYRDLLFNN